MSVTHLPQIGVTPTPTEDVTQPDCDASGHICDTDCDGDLDQFSLCCDACDRDLEEYGGFATVPASETPTPSSSEIGVTSVTSPPLEQVRGFLRRFVVLPNDETELLIALWVLHTYAIDAAYFTPYLHITGPTRQCGKSRLLEVLEILVAKPWLTSGATKAAVMRALEQKRPTLLFDEIDTSFSEEDDGLLNVLNSGYQRDKPCSISVKGEKGDWELKDFNVFGPKALSGIGTLPHTVEDRSLRVSMTRRQKHQVIERFRARTVGLEADRIREGIKAIMTPEMIERLKAATPALPGELSDRAQDVLEPLLAIAEELGVGEEARKAAVMATKRDAEDEGDINLQLLRDIIEILDSTTLEGAKEVGLPGDFVPTALLVSELNAMEDRPWPTCGRGGKPLDAYKLASALKAYKIKSCRFRPPTGQARGYMQKDIRKAAGLYL